MTNTAQQAFFPSLSLSFHVFLHLISLKKVYKILNIEALKNQQLLCKLEKLSSFLFR